MSMPAPPITAATADRPLWGVLAEFDSPESLTAAAEKTRQAGYKRFDCFTPFPFDGLSDAMGLKPTRLPLLVLAAAIAGGVGGYMMQYISAVQLYPIVVSGKPLHSWPAFIPITFECAVLAAGLTAVGAMIVRNGLPQPYHPLFNHEGFIRGSESAFFLAIEAEDPAFDRQATQAFLRELGASEVVEIEP